MTKATAQKQAGKTDVSGESQEDFRPETPSWFSTTYGETDMAENYRQSLESRDAGSQPIVSGNEAAYESYRKRLEDRFQAAQRLADPHFLMQDNEEQSLGSAFPSRPSYAHGNVPGPQKERKAAPLGLRPSTIAILTLMACSLGGLGGYVVANPEQASGFARQGVAMAGLAWSPAAPSNETVLNKKIIQTAKLEVKDVSGNLNSPIPLDISALPIDAETPVALKISGLPPEAYLTKGVEVAAGEWMLKAADFAKAELVVPRTENGNLALEVAALEEKTGEPAAPIQNLNVAIDTTVLPLPGVPQPKVDGPIIQPVNAVPDQGFNKTNDVAAVPVPIQSTNPEAQGFITKGDMLLKNGDVLAARQFYLRAFDMKVAAAAFGVGQTYDPAVYKKHGIRGLLPDAQTAAEWYGKAAAVGDANAVDALAQLPAQP